MLHFLTHIGDYYKVTKEGYIIRHDMPDMRPSGDWKFLGLQHVNKREFIPFNKINRTTLKNIQLRYKNGNPQYTVRDLDHGTTRLWGNTVYHGIWNIWFED